MSNPRAWRGRGRTTTPNSRQKRNKLFIDRHRVYQGCRTRSSQEAHHELPPGHPSRHDWRHMKALCIPCHITVHQQIRVVVARKR